MSAMLSRAPLVAASFMLLFGPAIATSQSPAAGPFASVPALPTACYTKGETFFDRITATRDATQAAQYKQQAVNQKIESDFQAIEPMEMATRTQQWMMKNPQEAMKYAQAAQQAGAETQAGGPELNEAAAGFETERLKLVAKYDTALKQAWASADSRLAALNAKLGPTGCNVGMAECRPEPWVVSEYNAIQKLRDTAYQGVCTQYWSATGQVPAHLKRYRDWLTQEWIPAWQKTDDVRLAQYAIMSTPATSWKSTIPEETAVRYMERARDFYSNRQAEPFCTAQSCR